MKHLALLTLAIVIAGPASSPLLATPAFAEEEMDEQQKKTFWQDKYRRLLTETETVRARLESNRTSYSKGRQRGRLRGGSGTYLTDLIASDEAKLAALEQELADFPDTARRAGIPPGWFRDLAPASAGN
jgi:hypothetical protein